MAEMLSASHGSVSNQMGRPSFAHHRLATSEDIADERMAQVQIEHQLLRQHEDVQNRGDAHQGMSQAQVEHQLIRQHEEDMVRERFTRWILVFSVVVCILLPVLVVLMIWLIVSFSRDKDRPCDVPLHAWFLVVVFNMIYHINFGGTSLHSIFLRYACRFRLDPEVQEPPPRRVKIYNVVMTLLFFLWHCMGIHWTRVSETCSATAPDLYLAVKVFASFFVVFTFFTYVSAIGLARVLSTMMRLGMISNSTAAPKGTLEKQAMVPWDSPELANSPTCSICLDDFGPGKDIRRTCCGHFYDAKCLGDWLKVNRTCPLCRTDLCSTSSAVGSSLCVSDDDIDAIV